LRKCQDCIRHAGYSDHDDISLQDVHISGPIQPNHSSAASRSTPPRPSGVSGNRPIAPSPALVAKSARIQGIVQLRATIGPDGLVQNLQLVGGPPLLVQSAMQAVRRWQYQPTQVNGSPVAVVTTVDVTFTLTP
jgi:protein TonB